MKNIYFIVFFPIFVIGYGQKILYNGYQVFQMQASFTSQHNALEILLRNTTYDYWIKKNKLDEDWTVMVPPKEIKYFKYYMKKHNISYREIINNVAKFIKKHEISEQTNNTKISFDQYHDLQTINQYLINLKENNPHVTLIILGESYEGQHIYGIKIGHGGNNQEKKPGILITTGIIGREWIGPAAALYIIEQIVNDPSYEHMYQIVDWYIIPILNPDGYEYTHTTDRMWQKNLTPLTECIGVDITKNFDFHWAESGSGTNDECSQEYMGPVALSEPETKALGRFMHQFGRNIKLYLSLHAFGPLLLYPYAWTKMPANNLNELFTLGEKFRKAIFIDTDTNYRIDPYVAAMYPTGGTDIDWMKGPGQVPLVYSLHMPAKESNFFDPVESEIEVVARELFTGIRVFHQYVEGKWSNL